MLQLIYVTNIIGYENIFWLSLSIVDNEHFLVTSDHHSFSFALLIISISLKEKEPKS